MGVIYQYWAYLMWPLGFNNVQLRTIIYIIPYWKMAMAYIAWQGSASKILVSGSLITDAQLSKAMSCSSNEL